MLTSLEDTYALGSDDGRLSRDDEVLIAATLAVAWGGMDVAGVIGALVAAVVVTLQRAEISALSIAPLSLTSAAAPARCFGLGVFAALIDAIPLGGAAAMIGLLFRSGVSVPYWLIAVIIGFGMVIFFLAARLGRRIVASGRPRVQLLTLIVCLLLNALLHLAIVSMVDDQRRDEPRGVWLRLNIERHSQ
ncbi:MAG: hypothetical protein GX591_01830 [Planctomycetes bacterium]|nr:hypothetical protein [Planctomycetota bacterium]